MEKVLDYENFHPERVEEKKRELERKKKRLQEKLKQSEVGNEDLYAIREELHRVTRQLDRGFRETFNDWMPSMPRLSKFPYRCRISDI